jgi:hypothetical protein
MVGLVTLVTAVVGFPANSSPLLTVTVSGPGADCSEGVCPAAGCQTTVSPREAAHGINSANAIGHIFMTFLPGNT